MTKVGQIATVQDTRPESGDMSSTVAEGVRRTRLTRFLFGMKPPARSKRGTLGRWTLPSLVGRDYVERMRRLVAVVLVSGLALSACGGESSLTEYATELEAAVTEMNGQLDDLDAELSETTDIEQVKRYAEERVTARYAFVRFLETLDPPSNVSDLHDAALGIMGRVADAESALADYVSEVNSLTEIEDFWSTPLGIAARSADAEAIELCLAAQAELDTTERSDLAGVPWIPPELKEVVEVAFGCIAEER